MNAGWKWCVLWGLFDAIALTIPPSWAFIIAGRLGAGIGGMLLAAVIALFVTLWVHGAVVLWAVNTPAPTGDTNEC